MGLSLLSVFHIEEIQNINKNSELTNLLIFKYIPSLINHFIPTCEQLMNNHSDQ
jgi:hypothetical protein